MPGDDVHDRHKLVNILATTRIDKRDPDDVVLIEWDGLFKDA
ncbi:hypothetical protein C7S15_0409 [Burkholderia cepacia]|nr:hypothetical protein [Burkholderia cepacia]